MPHITMQFNVAGQVMTRTDEVQIIADSRNMVSCDFRFNGLWDNITEKTVIFARENIIRKEKLIGNVCQVPHEMLRPLGFTVAVVGECETTILPTNKVTIAVRKSGFVDIGSRLENGNGKPCLPSGSCPPGQFIDIPKGFKLKAVKDLANFEFLPRHEITKIEVESKAIDITRAGRDNPNVRGLAISMHRYGLPFNNVLQGWINSENPVCTAIIGHGSIDNWNGVVNQVGIPTNLEDILGMDFNVLSTGNLQVGEWTDDVTLSHVENITTVEGFETYRIHGHFIIQLTDENRIDFIIDIGARPSYDGTYSNLENMNVIGSGNDISLMFRHVSGIRFHKVSGSDAMIIAGMGINKKASTNIFTDGMQHFLKFSEPIEEGNAVNIRGTLISTHNGFHEHPADFPPNSIIDFIQNIPSTELVFGTTTIETSLDYVVTLDGHSQHMRIGGFVKMTLRKDGILMTSGFNFEGMVGEYATLGLPPADKVTYNLETHFLRLSTSVQVITAESATS